MQTNRLETRLTDVDEPFDPNNVLHCDTWCRRYFHASEQSALLRFNIGVYQIYQAMQSGADEERRYTSHAAVMLHVLAAMHGTVQGVDAVSLLPKFWAYQPWGLPGGVAKLDKNIPYALETVAALTQQHCYCYTTLPGSVRRARIDAGRISKLTADLCVQAMSQIPPGKRAWAVQIEMERLSAFEWKAK